MSAHLNILYAFSEPLPINKARGIQVVNATSQLAKHAKKLTLAYVPVDQLDPYTEYNIDAKDIHRLAISNSWPKPFQRWHSITNFIRRLIKYIPRISPDLIYIRHLKLANALIRKVPDIPVIYEAHEVFSDTVSSKKQKSVFAQELFVIKNAHAIITNSQATAKRLQQLYGRINNVKVLHNGVNYPETLMNKPWKELGQHIIYSGSFFGWKGVDDLLNASAHLPDSHITFIGGSKTDLIKNSKLKLPNNLTTLNRISQKEVMEILEASCIAILPNRPDTDSNFTSPIKLFEYMAAGCAIVASDLPSIREVLDEDDAEWFKAGDSKSLLQAIQSLISDPIRAESMGSCVREKAKAFTWKNRAKEQIKFLEASVLK